MVDAGIKNGDAVYIRKQPTVENGQIAAVRINGEATLKRVYINGIQWYSSLQTQAIPRSPIHSPT